VLVEVVDVVDVEPDDVLRGAPADRTPLLPEDGRDEGGAAGVDVASPLCALPLGARDPVADIAAAALTIPEQSEPQLTP
jgi:hypothetical protein